MKNIIILTLILSFFGYPNTAIFAQQSAQTEQIIVSFSNMSSPNSALQAIADAKDFAHRHNVTIVELDRLKCIPNTFLWSLTGNLDDIIETTEDIKRRPRGASNNSINRGNPDFSSPPINNPTPPCDVSNDSLDAYNSCSSSADKPVLIAVLDDGLGNTFGTNRQPIDHKRFFQPYLWSNPRGGSVGQSFINDSGSPLDDNARHGSAVTSRIVDMLRKADVKNVKIMMLQTHNPLTHQGSLWNVCRALDFAYCHNANIVNMSLSGLLSNLSGNHEEAGTSALEVIIAYMGKNKSILVVAAAGNDGEDVSIERPDNRRYCTASYQIANLLEVAANARCSDALWEMSNKGQKNVHLTAPGDNVYCAVPVTDDNPSGIDQLTGTSLAAPHVAAAAAILASNRPTTAFNYAPIFKSIVLSVTSSPALFDAVISSGRLNTCNALTYFLRNFTQGIAAPPSNTEGSLSTAVNALVIAPNPTTSTFSIHFNAEKTTPSELVIRDMLGRVLVQQNWATSKGQNDLSVDASAFNKGIYFINIQAGGKLLVQKIIKE
jgi:subtilisin family serine protease